MLDFSSCGQASLLLRNVILPSLHPSDAWPDPLCYRPWTSSLGG
jgi:hypothetical protein